MTALSLTLPELTHTNRSFGDSTNTLSEWLSNLPYLSVVETTQEISDHLHRLNHSKVSIGQRLKLMEMFHQGYQRLHEALIDCQLSPINNQANKQALEAGEKLRNELATGYKLVVNGLLESHYRLGKDKQITLAIARAITYLGLLLAQHYQTYDQADGTLWQDISILFCYAEEKALLSNNTPAAAKTFEQITIVEAFKRIAFLRVSDPYRLPPGTVWDVLRYLDTHKTKFQLQDSPAEQAKAGVLALDLATDTLRKTDAGDKDRRWLNGRALIKTLTIDLETVQSGKQPKDIGFTERITTAETLQLGSRLLNLWARTPQRVMPRFSGTGSVSVVAGLNNIHRELLAGQYQRPRGPFDIPCTRLNRSAGGQALECKKVEGTELWVGQMAAIGITNADGATHWLPGIIRWLIRLDDESMRFGIQYVGEKLAAVEIRPTDTDTRSARSEAALDVELQHGGSILKTLITPCGTFQQGSKIEIIRYDESSSIRCIQLLESSGKLERFSYQSLDT